MGLSDLEEEEIFRKHSVKVVRREGWGLAAVSHVVLIM